MHRHIEKSGKREAGSRGGGKEDRTEGKGVVELRNCCDKYEWRTAEAWFFEILFPFLRPT